MSKIKVEEIQYGSFGKCLSVNNGMMEMVITIDVGPRIIRYALPGRQNILFEDAERQICQKGSAMNEVFGKDAAWYIYGGHRLWISPEAMPHSYYPDNDPVEYEVFESGVTLFADPQRVNDVAYTVDLSFCEDSSRVEVCHFITNVGEKTQTFAPWALTVLGAGGLEVIPMPDRKTGLLANRVLSLWDYTSMSDPRVYFGSRFITLRQDQKNENAFKLGINNEKGWAAYFANDDLFLKSYRPSEDGCYPDYGVSFETYTNNHFLEMETLGELGPVSSGSTTVHRETWQLFDGIACPGAQDETAIENTVENYLTV